MLDGCETSSTIFEIFTSTITDVDKKQYCLITVNDITDPVSFETTQKKAQYDKIIKELK